MKMIGTAHKLHELYVLDDEKNAEIEEKTARVHSVSLKIWHHRLGHPSKQCLVPIKDHLSFKSVKDDCDIHCEVCHLAKQRKLPFVSHNNITECCFDLIHSDVWGPYHVPSTEGYRYFLTLVDDHSRFTWIYLLKHKSDVLQIIPNFYQLILTQFQKKIKAFRSDNAKELQFKDFFAKMALFIKSHVLPDLNRTQW